jgi:hypothetical protein
MYSVVVTDSTGCARNLFFVITNPLQLTSTTEVSNEQCSGNGYFQINLTVSGGTRPYSFQWSNGATTEDLENLSAGTYQVEITDANGCTLTEEVIIDEPVSQITCLINPLETAPLCGSANNVLHTSVTDADSYSWSIVSSDTLWSIVGEENNDSVSFNAGNTNSSAIFYLTITRDGCTQTCSYEINTCVGDGGGGEDPEDEICNECFTSSVKILQRDESCTTYEAEISTNGNCRHELSHWTIAIPCGQISDVWNSEGWKMGIGTDPTTGLTGLKVDDIHGFGKSNDSFIVRFTVCPQSTCDNEWNPVVAYKAGQCVGYDSVHTEQPNTTFALSVYPNPFADQVSFEWVAPANGNSQLEILDQFGQRRALVFAGKVAKGSSYTQLWNAAGLPNGFYYYKLTTGSGTVSGKVFRN